MRSRLLVGLLLFGISSLNWVRAQSPDPNLVLEVAAVKAEMSRSLVALRRYTWTEHTEVLVKGDVKSATQATCRYDGSGNLIKTPLGSADEKRGPSASSNRPMVRKKADTQDYIKRSVSRIGQYLPPKPELVQAALDHGMASLATSPDGRSEMRFKDYFQRGDSVVFTYDSKSKVLLHVNVVSNLANPKDPVTMEAVFEPLPDGVNHLASTTLNASARKVQVKARNMLYEKLPD